MGAQKQTPVVEQVEPVQGLDLLDEVAARKAAAPGLYSLGNPMDRIYGSKERAPVRPIVPDPDGSDPGFVGVRPGDATHTAYDGTTVPFDPQKVS